MRIEDPQPPVVFVTGTSRGLGHYLRAALLAKKYVVYGSSRYGGSDSNTLKLDVTQTTDCGQAIEEVVQREGKIDVLINNVGSHLYGAAIETNEAELQEQLQTNFFGAVNMTRGVLPHMLRQGNGRIINISSVDGFVTKLSIARFFTPEKIFERLVVRQTAPELLDERGA